MIIWVYDRWGNQIDCLGDVIDFSIDSRVSTFEVVEFSIVGERLEKGNRLVWKDSFGEWHEDIVSSCDTIHSGNIQQKVYAEDSIVELKLSYINERDSYNFTNVIALDRCLQDTRWKPTIVDNLGIGDYKFYHTTVYEGLSGVLKLWGGEMYTQKMVNAGGVYERRLNWVKAMGNDYGLVFYYGFDTDNIQRKVELDDVYTRVHVFGKGEPTYTDAGEVQGYGRRISIAEVNGGKDYLENDEARAKWGTIDKNGNRVHAEGYVIFDQVTDRMELVKLGQAYLDEVSKPRVTYTANVAVLANAGMDFKNAKIGDTVYIRDEELDERLKGRVMNVQRHVGAKPAEITLGNITRTASDIWESQQSALDAVINRSAAWDGAAGANSEWLRQMFGNLNDEINADGGFVYWDYGEGITVYDKNINDDPTKAIQLKGGSLRIANKKNSIGEWEWSTFGTGDGFTASLINVGVLRCGTNVINLDGGKIELKDGIIIDPNGNYLNFGTGELEFVNKNKKGIHFLNGELTIDADSVKIGSTSIEAWTRAEIKTVGDSITLQVQDLSKSVNSQLTVLKDQVEAKVSKGDLESSVKAAVGNIQLKVTNGTLGSTASIEMTVAGQTKSANLDLKTGARKAFANDTSAITISAGTVTFNSNTFVVNSSNFSVSSNGTITAKAGTIACFKFDQNYLWNAGVRIASWGIDFGTSSSYYAGIMAYNQAGVKWLSMSCPTGYASIGSSTGNGFSWYERSQLALIGGISAEVHASNGLKVFNNMDMKTYSITNARFNTANTYFTNGVSGRSSTVMLPLNINSNGICTSWMTGCYFNFSRGILIGATF